MIRERRDTSEVCPTRDTFLDYGTKRGTFVPEEIFEKFPNVLKNVNPQIQKAQLIKSMINTM